jgi:hypothetical protein
MVELSSPRFKIIPTVSPAVALMPSITNKNSTRFALISAGLMTLAVVWLHLTFLTNVGAFWRDEVNLINVAAGKSIVQMTHDSCPILMPAMVRIWTGIIPQDNDFSLRILGLLIGLGLASSLWLNSLKANGEPPFWSIALLAMNSSLILFGDSIRAYGLGSLAMVLLVVAAVSFLKKPSFKKMLLLAAAAVVSVQSLYHDAILVGAVCFGLAVVNLRRKAWPAIGQVMAAGLVAALSLLPYVPVLMGGRKNCTPLYIGFKWVNLGTSLTRTIDFTIYLWIILSLTLAFLFFQQWRKPRQGPTALADDLKLFAGATWLAAATGFFIFLINSGLPTQPWYLLPVLTLGAVCFDLGIRVKTAGVRMLLTGYLLIIAVFALFYGRQTLSQRLTNMDDWAHELERQADRQDFIIVSPWFCGISFNHYYHGRAAWDTLPPIANHQVHAYDLVKDALQQTNSIQRTLEQARATLESGHRVWILTQKGGPISFANPPVPIADLPPAPFSTNGWGDMPYAINWTKQTAYFINAHAQNVQQIKNPGNRAPARFDTEQMEMSVAKGWRE